MAYHRLINCSRQHAKMIAMCLCQLDGFCSTHLVSAAALCSMPLACCTALLLMYVRKAIKSAFEQR
jgi:hypothetical protein